MRFAHARLGPALAEDAVEAMPNGFAILIEVATASPVPGSSPMPNSLGLSVLASDHLPGCVPFSERLRQLGHT